MERDIVLLFISPRRPDSRFAPDAFDNDERIRISLLNSKTRYIKRNIYYILLSYYSMAHGQIFYHLPLNGRKLDRGKDLF